MIMRGEVGRIWKEGVVDYFEASSWNLCKGLRKTKENLSGQLASRPIRIR